MDPSTIYDQVRQHYSAASQGTTAQYSSAIAKSFGYSQEELANIPEDANLGLSCGNPLAITGLRKGETILDLGSGAGFDVFLASTKLGASGRAIGIDMNDDMLSRANAIKVSRGASADNVSFLKGVITAVPLEDGIADCIISNCVLNLVPADEKHLVFREMYRLLKPGGRVAVSDILAKKQLPENLVRDMAMYVGCIAGASQVGEYEAWLRDAGFEDVLITDTMSDLNVYLDIGEDGKNKGDCCAPATPQAGEGANPVSCCAVPAEKVGESANKAGVAAEKTDLNEWVGSFKVYAVKA